MTRRLFILAALAAQLALGTNFAFVQKAIATQNGGNPVSSSTVAFSSNTTAGNIIVALIYNAAAGNVVTDTQGNTYTFIGTGTGGFPLASVYVALHIAGGADTVAAAQGSGTTNTPWGLVVMEYSSANPTYYACAGPVAHPGVIANTIGGITYFTSTHEVEIVWNSNANSSLTSWTATTGTVRFTGLFGFSSGNSSGAGDDNVASMPASSYTNTIELNGATPGSESVAAVFLNLDNPSCAGGGGVHPRGTFAILY